MVAGPFSPPCLPCAPGPGSQRQLLEALFPFLVFIAVTPNKMLMQPFLDLPVEDIFYWLPATEDEDLECWRVPPPLLLSPHIFYLKTVIQTHGRSCPWDETVPPTLVRQSHFAPFPVSCVSVSGDYEMAVNVLTLRHWEMVVSRPSSWTHAGLWLLRLVECHRSDAVLVLAQDLSGRTVSASSPLELLVLNPRATV